LVVNFQRSVIIAELRRPKVTRRGNFASNFCTFFGKTTPYSEIFKILFEKFSPPHQSTLLCSNVIKFVRREIGEIMRYLPNKQKTAASQTVATVRIAPKIYQGWPPTMCSKCSRFHQNRFTFGGVIAERVNTVFLPRRVFP